MGEDGREDQVKVGQNGRARQRRRSEWKVGSPRLLSVRLVSTFVRHRSDDLEVYASTLRLGNSANSPDGENSESDSSNASCSSPSKYDSVDFQSSLRGFEMSESKRKRLRELEASDCFNVLDVPKEKWLCSCIVCSGSTQLTVMLEVTLFIHLNILFKNTSFNLAQKTLKMLL